MGRSIRVIVLGVLGVLGATLAVTVSPALGVQESLWQPMTIAGMTGGYRQVDFADADTGWAATGYGAIARTTDGGLSWTLARAGDTSSIGDIAAVDEDCAWGAASRWTGSEFRQLVLRTVNGGQSWEETPLVSAGTLRDIEGVDADHAFAVLAGVVQATADGGTTWTAQPFSSEVIDVCFVDRDHGWARAGFIQNSEAAASVWRTTDAGLHWSQLTELPLSYGGYSDVDFADADHGYLVDGAGQVTASSADGGLTWTVGPPVYERGASICAVDASHAWIWTESLHMKATDDAGATWVPRPWPNSIGSHEFEIEGDRGWIVGPGQFMTERSGFSDMRAPVTGHDSPAFIRSSVQVILSPADEGSGVASTWFRIDQGVWQEGMGFALDVPPDAVSGDRFGVELSSSDLYGNWETGNQFDVTIDKSAPALSFTGGLTPLERWNGVPTSINIRTWDPMGASGAVGLYVSENGGLWELRETSCAIPVPAPLDHTNDGVHTVAAYGVDAVGNVGEPELHWVGIDTRRPRARAPYVAKAYSRGSGKIVFRLNDTQPCSGTCAAVITIKTLGGRTLGTMKSGNGLPVNRWLEVRFYCGLKPNKYRFFVKGIDSAGNVTLRRASNYLVVRKRTSTGVALQQMTRPWLGWEVGGAVGSAAGSPLE